MSLQTPQWAIRNSTSLHSKNKEQVAPQHLILSSWKHFMQIWKLPSQFGMFFVSRICCMLYYSLVCFVMPGTMQWRYFKFTWRKEKLTLTLKTLFYYGKVVFWSDYSNMNQKLDLTKSARWYNKMRILIYIYCLLLLALLNPDSSA